jgi:hypothetical protein
MMAFFNSLGLCGTTIVRDGTALVVIEDIEAFLDALDIVSRESWAGVL